MIEKCTFHFVFGYWKMMICGILQNGIFALKGNREGVKYMFYYAHYSNEDKEVME
jgi:hypothetical protein